MKTIVIEKPNNSLSLVIKTIDDWAEKADKIKIQLKNGKTFSIFMSDFLLECKKKDGKLLVSKKHWEEVV